MAIMEKKKTNQSPAIKARNGAVAELIERHADEYAILLGDYREEAGLPRDAEAAKREKRIAYHQEQLRRLLEGE